MDAVAIFSALLLMLFPVIIWMLCGKSKNRINFRNSHILITGGSSGIGKALAMESVKRGASVTIIARNEEKLSSAKQEIESAIQLTGQKIQWFSVDIGGKKEDVVKVVKEATSTLGPVDILINCAGITFPKAFMDSPPSKFQELFQTNVIGSVNTTQAVLPDMIERERGNIVFVSSQAGQCAVYGYTAYAATKFALRGLAECLQMEVKPYNILISISFPPDTDTPQLKEELETRPQIANEITASSGVFPPSQIAGDILNGIKRGQFSITHGFEGVLLGAVTAGFAPVHSLWEAFVQVSLMGIVRMMSFFYIAQFNSIVKKNLKKP